MPLPLPPQRAAACPRCGGPLLRVRRRVDDRLLNLFVPAGQVRLRYACRLPGCGWQGRLLRDELAPAGGGG